MTMAECSSCRCVVSVFVHLQQIAIAGRITSVFMNDVRQ